MEHMAVAIALSGPMLERARDAWTLLEQEFGVRFISSRSPFPHVALAGGLLPDPAPLAAAVRNVAARTPGFTMRGNGLGVFVAETPVLHVRWLLSPELSGLYHGLVRALESVWHQPSASSQPDRWLPKTTLAYMDLDYRRLSGVLESLRDYDFTAAMAVSEVCLVRITDQGESLFERFPLQP